MTTNAIYNKEEYIEYDFYEDHDFGYEFSFPKTQNFRQTEKPKTIIIRESKIVCALKIIMISILVALVIYIISNLITRNANIHKLQIENNTISNKIKLIELQKQDIICRMININSIENLENYAKEKLEMVGPEDATTRHILAISID